MPKSQYDLPSIMDNPFQGMLEETPRLAFYGTLQQRGLLGEDLPGARRRQAEDIYQQAMQGFYGKLGESALKGEEPTLQFTDYVQNQFPFTDRFAQLGRQYTQAARFSPPTRRLFF